MLVKVKGLKIEILFYVIYDNIEFQFYDIMNFVWYYGF